MRQIRYQVFISSTFRDVQQERQAVLDAILRLNHFPAGMELFPASDSTPWEIIERVIDDSDYYVLIVGGMYGSTDSTGISYTEREYNYAKRTGTPVLAFLHENPEAIPAGKVEMEPDARKKLAAFREKLQTHHCRYWQTAQDLQYTVAVSLIQEINLSPATGWVRASDATAVREAQDASVAAQHAAREAERQGKLREEAERRAQSTEAELLALRKREAEARAEAGAAADREADAIARERAAQRELERIRMESEVAAGEPTQTEVPISFRLSAAKALLSGDGDSISAFVDWSETPQGVSFWIAESSRVSSGKSLSPEARDTIVTWVERAEEGRSN